MTEKRTYEEQRQAEILLGQDLCFRLIYDDEKITGKWSIRKEDGSAVIFFQGEMERAKPFFGPQPYLDAKKGISYGLEIPSDSRLLSIYQHKNWWIRPAFPKSVGEIPARTQLLLGTVGGTYFAVLTVCGENCRTDLAGGNNRIEVTVASNAGNRQAMEDISLVITAGDDPYQCIHQAAVKALNVLGRPQMLRENRAYPEMFEYFGWCSWDAFYHQVSEEGLLEKMEEMKHKNIPLRWVLIDDGWLDADYENQVLKGFDADRTRFPSGLAHTVQTIKEAYPIDYVGVWHAVMGYWNGLAAGSEAEAEEKQYASHLPDGRILPAADAGRAFQFYDQWHSYLKNKCGIDFVKVDGQSAVSLAYHQLETYGKASGEIQKGLNASAALHFQNAIINCMGMAAEDMWNRPSSAISRSSDDFLPEAQGGFQEHALQNSYNSLLQGQFFWGDWDMFWSSHDESKQSSMLRAVSGGPVYVSDKVGKTDPEYILPLMNREGRILRCEDVGKPTMDCLFENPADGNKPLKVFNKAKGSYLVAAFHPGGAKKQCRGELCLADIGIREGIFLVYAFTEKKLYKLAADQSLPVILDEQDSELFVLIPVTKAWELLGILQKYNPLGCTEVLTASGEEVSVLVKEEGTLGFWAAHAPEEIYINGLAAEELQTEGEFYQLPNIPCRNSVVRIVWSKQEDKNGK